LERFETFSFFGSEVATSTDTYRYMHASEREDVAVGVNPPAVMHQGWQRKPRKLRFHEPEAQIYLRYLGITLSRLIAAARSCSEQPARVP
jgi:hypothetical protein